MNKSRLLGAVCACLIFISINANAVVVNTLNGVDYDWLELTATAGMSRNQVQGQIDAAVLGDALFGYEYASRQLIEDLFLSYSSWDGINGQHGASGVLAGINAYLNDFGRTSTDAGDGVNGTWNTVDGGVVAWDGSTSAYGIYGTASECSALNSCRSSMTLFTDTAGVATMAWQHDVGGWNSAYLTPTLVLDSSANSIFGSHLVRTSAVPIPATAWLFGSGLFGLIGVARREMRV